MRGLPSTALIRAAAAVPLLLAIAATPAASASTVGVVQERTPGQVEVLAEVPHARSQAAREGLIVELAPGARITGGTVIDEASNTVSIDVPAHQLERVGRELRHAPSVRNVERDQQLSWFFSRASINDPLAQHQWGLDAVRYFGTAPPERTPLIAFLDSGIDLTHPELSGNLPDGRPKVAGVWNAIDRSSNVRDDLGHGTATASVAAAHTNNGRGIASISPHSQVLMVKVGGVSGLSMSDAIRGLNWAVDNGARVVNMSFGSPRPSRAFYNAVLRAANRGVVLVAAVGNEGCAAEGGANEINYPAGYPHVIGVGATDARGRVTCFSNHGPEVDLVAPGAGVMVAVPRGEAHGVLRDPSGYMVAHGTSFAAPKVAAAAAILMAQNPRWRADQVASVLRRSARNMHRSGWDRRAGYGMLDLARARSVRRHGHVDTPEVNDDIQHARTHPPLLGPRQRGRTVMGSVSARNDPSDVYRVHLRRGQQLRLRAAFTPGVHRVRIWHPRARTTMGTAEQNRRLVARQAVTRRGASLQLRAGTGGWWYVQVETTARDARYRLSLRRR